MATVNLSGITSGSIYAAPGQLTTYTNLPYNTAGTTNTNVTFYVDANASIDILYNNSYLVDTTTGFHELFGNIEVNGVSSDYNVSSWFGQVVLTHKVTGQTIQFQLTKPQNAASNSGVNVEFLDGAVAFTSNTNAQGVWSVWATKGGTDTSTWGAGGKATQLPATYDVAVWQATGTEVLNPQGPLSLISATTSGYLNYAVNSSDVTNWTNVALNYTMTTAIETLPATGTLGNLATVSGVINGGVGDTYQTGDTINGGGAAANNTVNVTISATNVAAPAATINNVTNVNFRTLAAQTINAALWTGVTNVNANQGNNVLTITNGALASNYTLSSSLGGTADGLNIGIRAGDLTGATSTANVTLNSVGSTALPSQITTSSTGLENVTIATTGTNNFTFTGVTAAATDSALLTLTGTGTNTVTIANGGMAATATVNGGGLTNSLNLTVGTNVSTGDTYIGSTAGTGDVLRATTAGVVATNLNVSNFETLRLDSGANSTLQFTAAPNFTTVRLDAGVAGTKTLANVGSFTTLQFVGTGTAATAANQMTFNGVTATGGFAGAADTATVAFSNGGVTNTNAAPYVAGTVNVSGVENYAVTVADNTANTNTQIVGLISSTLQTVTISGTSNVTGAGGAGTRTIIDTQTAGSNSLTSVNLSGVTATGLSEVQIGTAGAGNVANILSAAATITAGAGGLTAVINQAEVATDVLTFTGAAGADTLTALTYLGNVIATGAGGADTFTIGNAGAGAATSNLTGGAGGDTFTLQNGQSALNVITDLGTGTVAGVTTETLTTAGAATGFTATVAANFVDANGGADTAVISLANAAALNVFNLNAGVTFTASGSAGAGGATVNANAAGGVTITGTANADVLNGAAGIDTLVGGAGNDVIVGGGGGDTINGGAGSDTMTGAAGVVDIYGQASNFGATGQSIASSAQVLTGAGIAIGNTLTFATGFAGDVDRVTNFVSGSDKLDVVTVGVAPTNLVGVAVAASGAANTTYVAYGNYAAGTGVFTIANAWSLASPDAIVYVGDGALTAATTTGAVVLTGLNQALVAADFI